MTWNWYAMEGMAGYCPATKGGHPPQMVLTGVTRGGWEFICGTYCEACGHGYQEAVDYRIRVVFGRRWRQVS